MMDLAPMTGAVSFAGKRKGFDQLVKAFEIGVALDLVHNGETGYRAKLKDYVDLAEGIKWFLSLNKNEFEKIKYNCRNSALSICSIDRLKREYI